ncbi:MAG TPA: DsrE family protein, partial [Polymorphobacter sp.]|nr:DsrE family protein [Polymorphobacter sp.]
PIPRGTVFKVVFDVSGAAEPGTLNRSFESAARLINMTVAAGVPLSNIHVAVVVHGKAAGDLLNDAAYAKRNGGKTNASAAPIAEMLTHNVDFYLCGQTAVAASIGKPDLINGVKTALSAMTAQALLQQAGYTLIP